MTCSILLLITLTSCVCGSFPPAAGTFVVNVTQSSYQAEENEDITLEWTFTTKPDSSNSLYIFCELITDHKDSVLYDLHEGVEVPESQDGQFSGRVQCDRDVLREGRLRLHVSRLRTEDSGLYLCEVSTTYGGSFGECRLTVTDVFGLFTAARDRPEPERPNTESRGMIGLYSALGLTAAAAALGVCYCLFSHFQPGEQSPPSQSQPIELIPLSQSQPGEESPPSQSQPGEQSPPSQSQPGEQSPPSQSQPGEQSPPSQSQPGEQTPLIHSQPGEESPLSQPVSSDGSEQSYRSADGSEETV
ncbi:neutral protease 2 homolog NFIA_031120-like isoform X2 [Siniperca chuatsi]|uniref:neutral protease 2 homolog NFIA_031120-like isoform X2 n=1 Tax=Siniperca chuatsi TaxID=119488 RepID=UPI001CE062AA|nr:neutral protease 2 homolog NFIA_031120-like isoform X2 [Siniperca chuatsi]